MKIFIGSPYKGLEEVRAYLHDSLSDEHDVIWMEDFGSQEVDTLQACLRDIDDADVYLLLLGARYGTPLRDSDYSYTQLEHEHAEKTGTPVLAYAEELPLEAERDPEMEDFIAQVQTSNQVEHDEFTSAEHLVELVRRDLARLRNRLLRPKFGRSGPISDEDAYVFGQLRQKVLLGAPFTVTLVDAGAISDSRYRPEKRGRLGDKIRSIERVAANAGLSVQVFNDFPVARKGDLAKLKARRVNENSRLVVVLIQKATATSAVDLFAEAKGEVAVFHGEWFDYSSDNYVVEFTNQDLKDCAVRAMVLELIETRVNDHVAQQTS